MARWRSWLALVVGVLMFAIPGAAPPAGSVTPGCHGRFDETHPPGACWRPFSDRSPFNRPLPRRPRQVPGSAATAAAVASWGSGPRIVSGLADTADDYGHPLYFNARRNPTFTVDCVDYGGDCELEGERVRIPDLARPAAGDDAHLAVLDQRRGIEYDFYNVITKPAGGGRLVVGWAGRTRLDDKRSKGLGAGATAASFALSAGIIRPAELRAGEIDHALFMTVPCTSGTSTYPAGPGAGTPCAGSDYSRPAPPAMGQRLYLEMSKREVGALPLPGWERTILQAMRRYGMFVGDTGGSGWGLKVESGGSATSFGRPDPWSTLGRRLGVPSSVDDDGRARYWFDLAGAVDWASELRVADPCVSHGNC
jgi:hypothetical protein